MFSPHDWNIDAVANIREAFPLPVALTQWVAEEHGLKHHWNWQKQSPAVATVDFIITPLRGQDFAIDVKMAKDRGNPRVAEKLKIVKLALELAGVSHEVRDENSVTTTFFNNYRFLRVHARCPEGAPVPQESVTTAESALREPLTKCGTTIREAAFAAHATTGLAVPDLMRTAYYLIGTHRWRIDMEQPIGPDHPVTFLNN